MITLMRLLFGVARIPVRLFSSWFMLDPSEEVMRCELERDRLRVALAAEEEATQLVHLPAHLAQQDAVHPPLPGQPVDLGSRELRPPA